MTDGAKAKKQAGKPTAQEIASVIKELEELGIEFSDWISYDGKVAKTTPDIKKIEDFFYEEKRFDASFCSKDIVDKVREGTTSLDLTLEIKGDVDCISSKEYRDLNSYNGRGRLMLYLQKGEISVGTAYPEDVERKIKAIAEKHGWSYEGFLDIKKN